MPLEEGNWLAGAVPLAPRVRKLTTGLDLLLVAGAGVVMLAWVVERPLFYSADAPVMSAFTALSLLIMVLVRLARVHLDTWPAPLSLAMTGLVLGGNLSSLMMLTMTPLNIAKTFPDIVVTSVMTSVGLMIFCGYDFIIALRKTPRSGFILDDMLLHLALVPGGVSLLGVLLEIPHYLSIGEDPRVGISLLEMGFMGLYAVSAVLSNPRLFLWQFLAAGWANRLAFGGLLGNQFIAPLVVAFLFSAPDQTGPGIELFVMLAGVVATLSFLLVQAYQHRSAERATGG